MDDFNEYTEPSVPQAVTKVSFTLTSELVPEVDENGVPTGEVIETEFVSGFAIVVSQFGGKKIHNAPNYQYLLDKNVFTSERLLAIQAILQDERNIIEGILLP